VRSAVQQPTQAVYTIEKAGGNASVMVLRADHEVDNGRLEGEQKTAQKAGLRARQSRRSYAMPRHAFSQACAAMHVTAAASSMPRGATLSAVAANACARAAARASGYRQCQNTYERKCYRLVRCCPRAASAYATVECFSGPSNALRKVYAASRAVLRGDAADLPRLSAR